LKPAPITRQVHAHQKKGSFQVATVVTPVEFYMA
jgi:hypothetical protein